MSMRTLAPLHLPALPALFLGGAMAALFAAGCNPAEGLCQKEFDCQEQLGLNLEDDYVAVCAASREGVNNALRKNAERTCKDLADAQVSSAVCQSTLSCDDLKKSRDNFGGDEDPCKDLNKGLVDALNATNNAADCDGIADDDDGQ
jgi:hypothetical protein